MQETELIRLRRRLEEGDLGAVPELARRLGRAESLPDWADLPGLMPRLVEFWRQQPDDRAPARLFLRLLGLEPAEQGRGSAWYRRRGRLGGEGPGGWDRGSGMPLVARRVSDGAELVLVAGGEMIRGTDELGRIASPAHRIILDPFYLDRSPVPRSRVAERAPTFGVAPDLGDVGSGGVTWFEADAYCRRVGGRLPTEAEYEMAMRGTEGTRLPWGEPVRRSGGEVAVRLFDHLVDRVVGEHPLRGHPAARAFEEVVRAGVEEMAPPGSGEQVDPPPAAESPFGLSEPSSNHEDWCADHYADDAYLRALHRNPCHRVDERPEGGPAGDRRSQEHQRVARAGSPRRGRRHISAAFRRGYAPRTRLPVLGFRVALSVTRAPWEYPPPGGGPAPRVRRRSQQP